MSSAVLSSESVPEDCGGEVLVFVTRDYWLRPNISRVLTHARAAAIYQRHVNPATGRIPFGRIPPASALDTAVWVYRASDIGMTTELKDRLLGLSLQFADCFGSFASDESYYDWLAQWEEAKTAAVSFIPAYSP